MKRLIVLLVLAIAGVSFSSANAAFAGDARVSAACPDDQISTVEGCKAPSVVSSVLTQIVKQAKQETRLQAVIARIDVGGKRLVRRAFGYSQTGVPASPAMNFRVGSMTIPMLTTVIYQLREEGRLRLTDPLSKWFPEIPNSSEITIRMLMNNTSGISDWIQFNQAFVERFYADTFQMFTDAELLRVALDRGPACEPGCFHYAHTNYLLLARILRLVAPNRTTVAQIRKRVLRPIGINGVAFSRLAPIPDPALSAFSTDRGVFEESTGWTPSWGLGNGMLATMNIDQVAQEAKGVLSGRTLNPGSRKDIVKQYGPDVGPASNDTYFAQGIIMIKGWRRQNPFFNGYMGNVAWFPRGRIAVSLVGTTGIDTIAPGGKNVTDDILDGIGAYLTPSNPPALHKPG
ncbi:MAG: serine hydrolase domain-containing protein [Solirubrobacterales bacterium]